MERRDFLRTGALLGLTGLGGGVTAPGSLGAALAPKRRSPDGTVKLSSNENPLGLCQAARQAVVDHLDVANRYTGDLADALTERLAAYHGVSTDQLVLGAGSTEVLQMAVQALHSPRAKLVIADPTFEDVPRYRRTFAYELERVPLTPDLAHDLDRMREIAEAQERPAVVYLCNPNNPTGTLTSSADIDAWIAAAPESVFFLVDEAYFEYAEGAPGYASALRWIHEKPNVLVVRTFSKIYGMAGLRLGYGLAHAGTISRLADFKAQNNANALAIAAAQASLGDAEHMAASLEVNRVALEKAHATLDELGLGYLPSHTNFVMHRIRGDLDAYIAGMREAGVRVGRPFPPMLDYNRLSLGLPEEMDQWSDAIRSMRHRGLV